MFFGLQGSHLYLVIVHLVCFLRRYVSCKSPRNTYELMVKSKWPDIDKKKTSIPVPYNKLLTNIPCSSRTREYQALGRLYVDLGPIFSRWVRLSRSVSKRLIHLFFHWSMRSRKVWTNPTRKGVVKLSVFSSITLT